MKSEPAPSTYERRSWAVPTHRLVWQSGGGKAASQPFDAHQIWKDISEAP